MKKKKEWRALTTVPIFTWRVADIVAAMLEKHGKISRGDATDAKIGKTAD